MLLIPVIDRAVIVDINSPVVNDIFTLVGTPGEAQTTVHTAGTVLIGNQSWDAMSGHPIAAKTKVRVKRVVLEVEEATSASWNQ